MVSDSLSSCILEIFDANSDCKNERQRDLVNKCLDLWDFMYEKDLGMARTMQKELMENAG